MALMIDEIDKKILKMLKDDGRRSYNSIAKNIGKSESTIRKRIKNLIKNNIIKGFTIKINNQLNGDFLSFLRITTDSKNYNEIIEYLSNKPEIIEIFKISGAYPIICKIRLNGMAEMEQFIIDIKELSGIKEIENSIVINEIKN